MRGKISNFPYINKIKDNFFDLNNGELSDFYSNIVDSNCVIPYGSGRSLYALNVGARQLAKTRNRKMVMSPDDPGFPGEDMYEAAPLLEKRYGKIAIVINSGGGESQDPLWLARDAARYIEESASEGITINLITSNPASSLGRIAKEHGCILRLAGGRGFGENVTAREYSESGIGNDVFELGSCFLFQMVVEALFRGGSIDEIFGWAEKELSLIGETVDRSVASEAYGHVIDILERHSDVFLGGKGTANEVMKMTGMRLHHVKGALGDEVYVIKGVNTPRPRLGDLVVLSSCSGKRSIIVTWCEVFKDHGCKVLSVTGKRGSALERYSDYKILLEEKVRPRQPLRFHMRSALALSPLPIELIRRLEERSICFPECLARLFHPVTD